jgi:hypothetical protein
MRHATFAPSSDSLTPYEAQALGLEDVRAHPCEAALDQLGYVLVTELLDVLAETALEDVQTLVAESLIGAFHAAAQRIERDADRARDEVRRLSRDFDGSEVADNDLQAVTRKAQAADVAVLAVEIIRDSASLAYTTATGDVWTPWRGPVRASRTTAALLDAQDVLRTAKERHHALTAPGAQIVAFRGSPLANQAEDAGRIFDALNWAREVWPQMALATSGAKGAEKLAIKWAKAKGVTLVLAKADFDRHGRAAPFRANDELLALDPVCVLTLANTLEPSQGGAQPFGPALNLGQKAADKGVRHVPITRRKAV